MGNQTVFNFHYISLPVHCLSVPKTATVHLQWLFYDWAPVNNGLVDFDFQPKGNALAASRIGNFIAPVVVLLGNGTLWHPSPTGDSGTFGYCSGETIQPEFFVSNFAPTALGGCSLVWKVHSASHQLLHNGSLDGAVIEQGTVKSVGACSFTLPTVIKPERFSLEVELSCHGLLNVRTNDWHAWVYPVKIPPVADTRVPVFAPTPLLEQLARLGTIPHLQAWPTGPLPTKAVYLVDQNALTMPDLASAITSGATAVMIAWNHAANASNSSMMPAAQPREVIYHNPTWMQTAQTPAALLINKDQPLGFLGSPSGWADASFFEAFGPKKGKCNWRLGMLWDLAHGDGSLPPGGPSPPLAPPPPCIFYRNETCPPHRCHADSSGHCNDGPPPPPLPPPPPPPPPYPLVVLESYVESIGARCLDGSPPAFYIREGAENESFIIDFCGASSGTIFQPHTRLSVEPTFRVSNSSRVSQVEVGAMIQVLV